MNSNSQCTTPTPTFEDERKTLMHKLLLKKFQGTKNLDKKGEKMASSDDVGAKLSPKVRKNPGVYKRSELDAVAFADKAKSFQIHAPTMVDSSLLSGQSMPKER